MGLINRIFLIVLASLLSACSVNLPFSKNGDGDDNPEQTVIEGADGQALFVPIANPFPPDDSATPQAARNDFEKAKEAIKAQRLSEAESLLTLMSETYPNLSGIYTNLGIVYLKQQAYLQAEKAAQFAIGVNMHNFDAYIVLGLALREQGKFSEAEKNYLAVLNIWPHHNPSQRNLGILYDLYMGKLEKAVVHYEISQQISGGEDKELKNWIIDIKRRIASQAKKAPESEG